MRICGELDRSSRWTASFDRQAQGEVEYPEEYVTATHMAGRAAAVARRWWRAWSSEEGRIVNVSPFARYRCVSDPR